MAQPAALRLAVALALDTNVVVDLMRHEAAVRANYDRAVEAGSSFCISVVVLQELIFGAEASDDVARERAKIDQLLHEIEVVPFEPADADVGGRAQAAMKKRGRKAPIGDFIVGVHALAREATLVTANTRHFENIPGLKLLDWRQPPQEPQD